VTLTRRKFLGLLGGAVAVGGLGAGGLLGVDERLRHKLEDAWAYADGPDWPCPPQVPGSSPAASTAGSCSARWAGLLCAGQGRAPRHRAQPLR